MKMTKRLTLSLVPAVLALPVIPTPLRASDVSNTTTSVIMQGSNVAALNFGDGAALVGSIGIRNGSTVSDAKLSVNAQASNTAALNFGSGTAIVAGADIASSRFSGEINVTAQATNVAALNFGNGVAAAGSVAVHDSNVSSTKMSNVSQLSNSAALNFGNGIAASQRSGSLGFRVAMTLNY